MTEIIKEGNKIIVKPSGDIVASMINNLKAELYDKIHGLSGLDMIFDLAEVDMIDSAGMSVILATHNSLSDAGGKLKVINVADNIYKLFTIMRLDKHFPVERKK